MGKHETRIAKAAEVYCVANEVHNALRDTFEDMPVVSPTMSREVDLAGNQAFLAYRALKRAIRKKNEKRGNRKGT